MIRTPNRYPEPSPTAVAGLSEPLLSLPLRTDSRPTQGGASAGDERSAPPRENSETTAFEVDNRLAEGPRLAGFNADLLAWINNWLREPKVARAANYRIVNLQISEPIAQH